MPSTIEMNRTQVRRHAKKPRLTAGLFDWGREGSLLCQILAQSGPDGAGTSQFLDKDLLDLVGQGRGGQVHAEDAGIGQNGPQLAMVAGGVVPDDALELGLKRLLQGIVADLHLLACVIDTQ